MTKRRVSAKQRLELIQGALYEYQNNNRLDDFLDAVSEALFGQLEPKHKQNDEDIPF